MKAILIDSHNLQIKDVKFKIIISENYHFFHEKCSGVKYVPVTSDRCEMMLVDIKKRKYVSGFNFKGEEEFFIGNGLLVGFNPTSFDCTDTKFTAKLIREKVLFKKLNKWTKSVIEYNESGLINKDLLNFEQIENYIFLWNIVCKSNSSWKKYTNNINIVSCILKRRIFCIN